MKFVVVVYFVEGMKLKRKVSIFRFSHEKSIDLTHTEKHIGENHIKIIRIGWLRRRDQDGTHKNTVWKGKKRLVMRIRTKVENCLVLRVCVCECAMKKCLMAEWEKVDVIGISFFSFSLLSAALFSFFYFIFVWCVELCHKCVINGCS